MALKTGGALGVVQVGATSGFAVTPSSAAPAGQFSITVDGLATAAKARSAQFTSVGDPVRGGTLDLSVNGTSTSVTLTDGMTLGEAAAAINNSGASVNAMVLQSNGQAYLSITNKNTGFTPGQSAASGLSITETSTGSLGQALGLSVTQPATNAQMTIDGLSFERSSNTITDAIPGVSFQLQTKTTVAEDLVLGTDPTATAAKLQTFVTAYNDVMKILHNNLNIGENIDRNKTLGGDSAIRSLQSSLMSTISAITNPASSVRSLADLGITTQQADGSLALDTTKLTSALATDSGAVNALFQQATVGVGDHLKSLVDSYTNSVDGIFVSKSQSYTNSVKLISTQIDSLQLRLDAYRAKLVSQFAAMEKIVSGFKSIGSYLTSQDAAKAKG
jgi:flagellar hook-associated protein 2